MRRSILYFAVAILFIPVINYGAENSETCLMANRYYDFNITSGASNITKLKELL